MVQLELLNTIVLIFGSIVSVRCQVGSPLLGPFTGPVCNCPAGTTDLTIQHSLDPDFNVVLVDGAGTPIPPSVNKYGTDALRCFPRSNLVKSPKPQECLSAPNPYTYHKKRRVLLDFNNSEKLIIVKIVANTGQPSNIGSNAFIPRRLQLKVKRAAAVIVKAFDSNGVEVHSCQSDIPNPNKKTNFRCDFCGVSVEDVRMVEISLLKSQSQHAMIRSMYLSACKYS